MWRFFKGYPAIFPTIKCLIGKFVLRIMTITFSLHDKMVLCRIICWHEYIFIIIWFSNVAYIFFIVHIFCIFELLDFLISLLLDFTISHLFHIRTFDFWIIQLLDFTTSHLLEFWTFGFVYFPFWVPFSVLNLWWMFSNWYYIMIKILLFLLHPKNW